MKSQEAWQFAASGNIAKLVGQSCEDQGPPWRAGVA